MVNWRNYTAEKFFLRNQTCRVSQLNKTLSFSSHQHNWDSVPLRDQSLRLLKFATKSCPSHCLIIIHFQFDTFFIASLDTISNDWVNDYNDSFSRWSLWILFFHSSKSSSHLNMIVTLPHSIHHILWFHVNRKLSLRLSSHQYSITFCRIWCLNPCTILASITWWTPTFTTTFLCEEHSNTHTQTLQFLGCW